MSKIWDNHQEQQQQQLVRNGNVEDVFNVLLEKVVNKIINVSIDDDEDLPHSDEVIEALEKFDIEEWDWRRKDLCSSVIPKAARNSRKVAVIDDEIDKPREDFEDSVVEGISCFSPRKDNIAGTRQYYFSTNGHGTLMAKRVRRLWPKVKLCIVRLDQEINGEPTIESAIKAISWATAIGVDIISMSWTFPELKNIESRRLGEVIDEAHKKKILTLASVSDQGYNRPDMSFPGKIPGVFRIGAARDSGVPDDLAQGYEFLFPGGSSVTNVRQREKDNTGANSKLAQGSSFATAVASGLAALILHCAELCDLGDENGDDLRQYQNMKDIFHVMALGSPQSSYIQAEKWFPTSFENKDWMMEDEDQDEFRRRITAIIT
ncbi:hypothetical protein ABOM_006411 [Aspergillus bombycis]|uniref:Peptidase S8/S53 domain-containing protein n=1 Tax=Aspergillus bombycis TaxID=109264 RepID=A0A1F8A0P2_9EURO|nr:hypothetical protein ABOM_006411 [Aspergillus bombycis]OGM45281.1 hypothetical protein ABOM_006411 [Aspergillus bombycis]